MKRSILSAVAAAGLLVAAPAMGATVDLDFANASFDQGTDTLTFADVLGSGSGVDLVAAPTNGTILDSFNEANNGTANVSTSEDGRINLNVATNDNFVDLAFSFRDASSGALVDPGGDVVFGFFDLDFTQREALTFLSQAILTVTSDTDLVIDTDGPNTRLRGAPGNVPNVSDSTDLSDEQEDASVNANFGQVSEFTIRYAVLEGAQRRGRNLFFTGELVFDDNETVDINTIPLPASWLALMAALGGFGLIARKRAAA